MTAGGFDPLSSGGACCDHHAGWADAPSCEDDHAPVTGEHIEAADGAMYELPLDTTTPAEVLRDALAQLIADAEARGAAQLRRILADVLVDNDLTCEPHPDNKRCVCSTARAQRVLNGEEEW